MKRIVSDKLGAKSDKYLFVGYPKETWGYYFYHTLEQKVFVSKNVVFLEKEFLLKEDKGSKVELDEVHDPQIGYKSTDWSRIYYSCDEIID